MSVITISGHLGSGAKEIGQIVAHQLGMEYIDREILVDAAHSLGVPVDAVEEHDERPSRFSERLAGLLRTFLERSAAAGASDPIMGTGGLEMLLARTYGEAAAEPPSQEQGVDDTRYIKTLHEIISALAERDNVVIVGRGGQAILRGRPNTTHVSITCPFDLRVQRIVETDGMKLEDAMRRVQTSDRGRAAFHKRFFKVDLNDPYLYHLTLNSARMSFQAAADIICAAVRMEAPLAR
jgi:cytidylate kinase